MACLACVGSARLNSNNFFDGSPSLIGSGRDRSRGLGFCSIRKSRNNNCSFSCNKWKWKWSRTHLYLSLATPTSLVELEAKSLVTEIGNENDKDLEADVDAVLKSRPKPMLRAAPPAPTRKLERPDLVRSVPHNEANNNAIPNSLLQQEAKSLATDIGNENDNDVKTDVNVDVDMDVNVNVVLKSRPKPLPRAAPPPASTRKLERPDMAGPRWARSVPLNKADNNNASSLRSQTQNKLKTSNDVWKKGNPISYVPRVSTSTSTTEISQEKENLSNDVWKKGNPISHVPRVSASTSTTEISQEKENLDEVIFRGKRNLDEETTRKEERNSMPMPMLAKPQPLKPKAALQGKPMPRTMPTSSSKVPAKKQVVLKDLGAAPRKRQVVLKDVGAAPKSKQEFTMKSRLVNEDVNVSPSARVAGVAASSRVGTAEGSGSPFRSKDKLKRRPGSALRKSKANMSDTGEEETDLNFSSGRKGRKFNKANRKAARVAAAKAEAPVKVEILEVGKQGMSVVELAQNLAVTEGEILTSLFMKGIRAFVTQTLDKETVKLVCKEHDVEVIESDNVKADYLAKKTEMLDEDDLDQLQTRPPILTIMGHVDHGKTTLLDYIRKSKVAASEAGGITQGIGAYTVFVPIDDNLKPCVFLDTPGHEAFSAMRARGAKVTDIAIIVVAADDGVRPQTNEAIAHAKAADVPIVVAINKIDKEGASQERVMQELASIGLLPEEWGGDVPMVPVSALTGQNVNELLETVMLVAELQELKANPNRNSKGTVIEASLHNSRGPLATFLVQNGTLKKGDIVVCGESYGKIRALFDDTGASVDKASPSMAVQVIGLSNVPIAGDEFETVSSLDIARERAEECALKIRDERLSAQSGEAQVTLSSLGTAITDGNGIGSNRHQLNLILKVDVQGSVAAIREALDTLPQDTVNLRFLMEAVGDINVSDVNLASASEAIVVGFNVRVLPAAQAQAENESVEICTYRVIYELVDVMRNAMEGLLKPVEEQVPIGSAEVRAVFNNGSGHAAGCMVTEGKAVKGCGIRVVRNGKVAYTGTLDSLRRVKEVVKERSTIKKMTNSQEEWPQTPCPSGYIGTRPKNARDKAWRYAYEAPNDIGKVICIPCERIISGGINRLKYHLAGIKKHDSNPCLKVTDEEKRFINALLAAAEEKKLNRERAKLSMRAAIAESEGAPFDMQEEEEALENIPGSLRGPRIRKQNFSFTGSTSTSPTSSSSPSGSPSGIGGYFVPRNTPGAQPSLEGTAWFKEVHEQTDIAASDFWFFNNISMNAADSPYWFNMVNAMTISGKGYKPPNRKAMSGRLLDKAVGRATLLIEDQKKEWKKYGCTILSDGWTDGRSRTIINFLVACKDDVVFWKSVDASNKVKNAATLALMLENVVMEVGIENVVQIITDNAAAYVAAGRILQERHPTLFWSPCAAHVLDLLLEDIGKLDWVSPVVEDARRVTKYIYNHPWVLSLMRKATKGKDLMRPAMTRFATVFLTLQSILDHILALKQMFVCADWVASPYSKKPEGEAVARIVFDESFFAKAKEIVEMSLPLVLVLRICDGQQSPMGGLYEAMDRAKEAVRSYYHRDSLRFDPIWEIIDRRWNNMLHQPIHAAGYFLNPKFRADDSYSDPNGEVMEGLSKCIERMISSEEERDLIVTEQQIYVESRGPLFSSMLAKRARSTQAPDAWWASWGGNTPNLRKFALRVLSQPCSSSHCERNWSLFESIHTKKRNRMTQKRLNDLVYVHYNLKLRIKKTQLLELPGPLDLDEIDPYSDWTAQESGPLFTPDEIADLERQAMEGEADTDFQFTMDDIEDEDEDDDDSGEDQALPLGGDASSSRTLSQSVGMSSEGAQPQSSQSRSSRPIPVRGTSSRARPPRFPTSPSGKRKM